MLLLSCCYRKYANFGGLKFLFVTVSYYVTYIID